MGVFGWDSYCLMFFPIPGQKGSWQSIFRNFIQVILKCHSRNDREQPSVPSSNNGKWHPVGITILTFSCKPELNQWQLLRARTTGLAQCTAQDIFIISQHMKCSIFHFIISFSLFHTKYFSLCTGPNMSNHRNTLQSTGGGKTFWVFLSQAIDFFPFSTNIFLPIYSVEISPGMLPLRLPRY